MKKQDKLYFKIVILAISIIIAMMIFLPSYQIKESDYIFKGYELAFGKELGNFLGLAKASVKVNIILILAYFLPVIGSIMMIYNKKLSLITALLFLASGVLFIFAPNTLKVHYDLLGQKLTQSLNVMLVSGAIVGSGLSFFGMVLALYHFLKIK